MTKFGYKLSTSIAAMMLSVTAAQNALAQSRNHNPNPGNHNPITPAVNPRERLIPASGAERRALAARLVALLQPNRPSLPPPRPDLR